MCKISDPIQFIRLLHRARGTGEGGRGGRGLEEPSEGRPDESGGGSETAARDDHDAEMDQPTVADGGVDEPDKTTVGTAESGRRTRWLNKLGTDRNGPGSVLVIGYLTQSKFWNRSIEITEADVDACLSRRRRSGL